MIDITFGIDIIINFITAYEDLDGRYEVRLKKIAINYITGFFIFDVLATFPFQQVVIFINEFSIDISIENSQRVDANSLLRIVRLQRLQRLTRITRLVKLFSIYSADTYGSFLRVLVMKFEVPR